jgi:hypothetical protein
VVPLETACCIVELLYVSSSTLKEVPQECIWLGNSPLVTLGKGTRQDETNKNVSSIDKFVSVFHFFFLFFLSFSQTLSIHLRCINVSSGVEMQLVTMGKILFLDLNFIGDNCIIETNKPCHILQTELICLKHN